MLGLLIIGALNKALALSNDIIFQQIMASVDSLQQLERMNTMWQDAVATHRQSLTQSSGPEITFPYEWAQAKDAIFMRLKIAPRFSAPAVNATSVILIPADGSKTDVVEVVATAENGRRYRLQVNLFGYVLDAKIKKGSVGKIEVTAKKVDSVVWPRLLNDDLETLPKVWYDLATAYEWGTKAHYSSYEEL